MAHWLYEWIDEYDIRNVDDVDKALSTPGAIDRLREIASAAPEWTEGDEPAGRAIVAGSTMDFSGRLSCTHAKCLETQIDRLFGRVWHYFDSVVVEGPSSDTLVSHIEGLTRRRVPELSWMVRQDVTFLLRLRDLGIPDHLAFRKKAHQFCQHHIEEHAAEAGIAHFFDSGFRKEWAVKLKQQADFSISPAEGGAWHYSVTLRSASQPFTGFYRPRKKGTKAKKPTKREVAEDVIRASAIALVYDVATSKFLSLPLAEELPYLSAEPFARSAEEREARVALQLPLPVMQGLTARDAISLRKDLKPHFDRFQHALTVAIREQLSRDPDRADSVVAKAVFEEFIRPEFADIERALQESKKSLSVKAGASLAVGTTVASVGLLGSVPLVVGSGLAAIGVTLSSFHKFVDDRKEVKTSDVYFLWKAKSS